jgi:8-oxo-dGTP diphosphatase
MIKTQILFGTTNKAKLDYMRKNLSQFENIEIIGLSDIDLDLSGAAIDESGRNPLENARIKAAVYYDLLQAANMNLPVFSCDSGLYIDGLTDESLQPGTHVRNVNGKSLSDEEMIEYYSNLAKNMGGQMTAQYKNAICFAVNENGVKKIYEHMGEDIASEKFIITQTPHKKMTAGFPLDSLSVEMKSGKYFYDVKTEKEFVKVFFNGYAAFFARVLNLPYEQAKI